MGTYHRREQQETEPPFLALLIIFIGGHQGVIQHQNSGESQGQHPTRNTRGAVRTRIIHNNYSM